MKFISLLDNSCLRYTIFYFIKFVTTCFAEDMGCWFIPADNTTYCYDGSWPANNAPDIGEDTEILAIKNVHISSNSTIPLLPNLQIIEITNCRLKDSVDDNLRKFPLIHFTSNIFREKVRNLLMENVVLASVSKSDFDGFTQLLELTLRKCSINYFHPDTMQAFTVTGSPITIFQRFVLENDQHITNFPWVAFWPVSKSLRVESNPFLMIILKIPCPNCMANLS